MSQEKKQMFFLYDFWERKLEKKESTILEIGLKETLPHMSKL
jgi:hypothetical protein